MDAQQVFNLIPKKKDGSYINHRMYEISRMLRFFKFEEQNLRIILKEVMLAREKHFAKEHAE